MGSSKSATAPFHSESVRRVTCTPWRSKICSSRYNGRWSAYLEPTTCANNPGPGRPFDGTRWQDGLHHALLAAPAGVLRSHILPDYKRRRHVVQFLGDVRTDAHLRAVAGRTVPLTGRRHHLDAFAGQIGW